MYGDVNNDGIINRENVNLIIQCSIGSIEFDKYQTIAADVNADGKISSADALLVLRLIEGAIDELPVGTAFLY